MNATALERTIRTAYEQARRTHGVRDAIAMAAANTATTPDAVCRTLGFALDDQGVERVCMPVPAIVELAYADLQEIGRAARKAMTGGTPTDAIVDACDLAAMEPPPIRVTGVAEVLAEAAIVVAYRHPANTAAARRFNAVKGLKAAAQYAHDEAPPDSTGDVMRALSRQWHADAVKANSLLMPHALDRFMGDRT